MVFELFHSVLFQPFLQGWLGVVSFHQNQMGQTAIEEALQIVSDDGWYEREQEDLYE